MIKRLSMEYRSFCASVLASVLLCGTTGCGTGSNIQAEDMTAHVHAQLADAASPDETFESAQTAFALHLMQAAVQAEPDENMLLSPYSLMQVLAMTANGAAGNTLAEIEQALGGIPAEQLSSYLYGQRTALPVGAGRQFKTVNSIWVHNDENRIKLPQAFIQKTVDYFGADIFRAPFDESTRTDINNWCRQKTDGVIPEILSEPIPVNAAAYLCNAVNFDAKWEEKYEEDPVQRYFTQADGQMPDVQMMLSEESTYLKGAHAEGFLKPYKDGTFAFVGILPEEKMTPAEYLAQITADDLYQMLQHTENSSVEAGLPEFTSDWGAEMKPILEAMGIRDAFTMGVADLSNMNEADNPLYISKVLHKTHIEVDVNGTKATAVTLEEQCVSCAPPQPDHSVILDRPFVYMIVETKTMTPVFAGVCNKFT